MPRTQVFEIELEVPDDAPEFETRLRIRSARENDWILTKTLQLKVDSSLLGSACYVAIPKKTWRPATREDVAAQILGTKDFEWRMSDNGIDWQYNKCVGYDNDSSSGFVFLCRKFCWERAEVLA